MNCESAMTKTIQLYFTEYTVLQSCYWRCALLNIDSY